MASQVPGTGAALQEHNNQLVACIEDLRQKRGDVDKQLQKELEEKNQIQNDLVALQKRLAQINVSIQHKEASREEYDKTIVETQAAYMKILESSQTLLNVLKRESAHIQKKKTTTDA